MLRRIPGAVVLAVALCACSQLNQNYSNWATGGFVVEVRADPSLHEQLPAAGRMFVILRPVEAGDDSEVSGDSERSDSIFAVEVSGWDGSGAVSIDATAMGYPTASLADLPDGTYLAQPFYCVDPVFSHFNAPGNFFGPAVEIEIERVWGMRIPELLLDARLAPEEQPEDTEQVRYVRVRSELLSAFLERPVDLEAAVILPRGYDDDPEVRYPLRIHRGGRDSRAADAFELMAEGSEFRAMWLADRTPRMIMVHLDSRGPFGDPRLVDSDCNGPWGSATLTELIPFIEKEFRAVGTPEARFLDGASATGGWAVLAMQVIFPDAFNGVWSACADSVDFRALGLIDIYEDDNAYLNEWDIPRPMTRDPDGDPSQTVGMEVWKEQVLGRDGRSVRSGGAWGSLNAVCSPRGVDLVPRPLWDGETGDIDQEVAEHWRGCDLRLLVTERWSELGPKLEGKLRISMGDMNSGYNNNAMHLFARSLRELAEPAAGARVVFGPGEPYCWQPLTHLEIMEQMVARWRRTK